MTESSAQQDTSQPETAQITAPGPGIRKAPDADRHPALAAHTQVDLRESDSETPDNEATHTGATAAEPKKSLWSRLFSRA